MPHMSEQLDLLHQAQSSWTYSIKPRAVGPTPSSLDQLYLLHQAQKPIQELRSGQPMTGWNNKSGQSGNVLAASQQ